MPNQSRSTDICREKTLNASVGEKVFFSTGDKHHTLSLQDRKAKIA